MMFATRDGSGVAPFGGLLGVHRQLERMLEEISTGVVESWTVPTDIVENEKELRFALELPGLAPEQIDLTVENGVLTVGAEKKAERREAESGERYRLLERRWGRFTRSFRLPSTVDVNRVEAKLEHGVLQIRLPRLEEARPRRISIAVNDGAPQQVESGEVRQ